MRIEDVHPLTIVAMKYGGKFAIVEGLAVYQCVTDLQENEEVSYDPQGYMSREWEHIKYGVGNTIAEAFENFTRS